MPAVEMCPRRPRARAPGPARPGAENVPACAPPTPHSGMCPRRKCARVCPTAGARAANGPAWTSLQMCSRLFSGGHFEMCPRVPPAPNVLPSSALKCARVCPMTPAAPLRGCCPPPQPHLSSTSTWRRGRRQPARKSVHGCPFSRNPEKKCPRVPFSTKSVRDYLKVPACARRTRRIALLGHPWALFRLRYFFAFIQSARVGPRENLWP